jgi:hypothetical protein
MFNDQDINQVAAIIYGEGASTDDETMRMIGSSVFNRLDANRAEEFGDSIASVGQKGYYAVKDNTDLYQQAVTGKFPDKVSEDAYKRALAQASGLAKGTIDRHSAMFFFKDKEVKNLKSKGSKVFNFDAVNEGETVGEYRTYSYGGGKKQAKSDGSFNEAFAKARKSGKETFTWRGNSYTTEVKK